MRFQLLAKLLKHAIRLINAFGRPLDLQRVAAGNNANTESITDHAEVRIALAVEQ